MAGCLAHCPARDPSMPGWREIQSLYLLPRLWGTGAAQTLFDAVLEELERMKQYQIYLWALRENLRARRFYEKQGFTPNGDTLNVEIQGKMLTDLRYIRDLSQPV